MRIICSLAILVLTSSLAQSACPQPGIIVRDITADRFYIDAASSVPDEAILARNKASLAALDHNLYPIIKFSDAALTGETGAAQCAIQFLIAEARGGGMLGTMSSRQAGYERKWRTAGVALAYLKVKRWATPDARATIEPWLTSLALNVETDYGAPKEPNNHYYWAGLASAAVGTATGDGALLAYARRAYLSGLESIQPDGVLPRELARKGRALSYHNYALAPLILMAELAAARGEDWYQLRDGAIHRLVARTVSGIRDPAAFARLAGVPTVEIPTGGILGWLAFYRARFPRRAEGAPNGPFNYNWLGGNLTLIAAKGLRASP